MKTTENAPTRTVITPKGQVVIPAKIRRHLGIKGSTQVSIYERNGEICLIPTTPETIENNFGLLKGGRGNMTKALLEERKKEREREDSKS